MSINIQMQTTMEAVVAVAMTGGTTMEEEVEDMAGTTMVRMIVGVTWERSVASCRVHLI